MATVTTSPILPRYDQHFTLSYSYPSNALSGGNYQLQTNSSPASSITTISGEYISRTSFNSTFISNAYNNGYTVLQGMAFNPLNQTQIYVSLRKYGLYLYDSSAQTMTQMLTTAQMKSIDNCAVAADASYVYLAHNSGVTDLGTFNGCVFRYRLSDASFMNAPFVNLGVATGVVDANKNAVSLFLSGDKLYIGGLNTTVYVTDLSNSNPVTNTVQFYQGANTTNTLLAVDANELYYTTLETNVIYSVPLNNLNLANTTTLAILPSTINSLSISGTQLFATDGSRVIKISTVDGSYSTVDTVSYVKNAVMNSAGNLFSLTANSSPIANTIYRYAMNTSIQFSDVFYPYYTTAFVFNLYNNTKNTILDTFSVNITCFLEGTKILCLVGNEEKYIRIEHLKKGTLIKTLNSGYLPLEAMGRSRIYHNPRNGAACPWRNGAACPWRNGAACPQSHNPLLKDSLYIYRNKDGEDLCVTGMHSALVEEISAEEREAILDTLEDVYLTEGLYRLPACADKRAEIYDQEGYFNVFHIALANTDYYGNYGVYANGLLMESTSLRYLKELSQMELIVDAN